MPRRSIWSARQRAALSDDDIEHIRVRRGEHNRLGFALQLCAFRYPGRILVAGEAIPRNVLRCIAAQLGRRADSGLSVRFCPLPESTPTWAARSSGCGVGKLYHPAHPHNDAGCTIALSDRSIDGSCFKTSVENQHSSNL